MLVHAGSPTARHRCLMFVACSRPMGCGSSSRRRKSLIFVCPVKHRRRALQDRGRVACKGGTTREERIDDIACCVLYFDGASSSDASVVAGAGRRAAAAAEAARVDRSPRRRRRPALVRPPRRPCGPDKLAFVRALRFFTGVKPVACPQTGRSQRLRPRRVSARKLRAFFVSLSGRRGCPDGIGRHRCDGVLG